MTNQRSKSTKPVACAKCKSEHIVPIVDGALDTIRATLSIQGHIALRGSFALENGDAIWACAECGEPERDPQYAMRRDDYELVKAYEQAVQSAFDAYKPIDDAEYRRLNGKRLLLALIQQNFVSDVNSMAFEPSDDDLFVVLIDRGDSTPARSTNSLFTLDRLEQIQEFLAANRGKPNEIRTRIDKSEVVFAIEQISGGGCVIQRMRAR